MTIVVITAEGIATDQKAHRVNGRTTKWTNGKKKIWMGVNFIVSFTGSISSIALDNVNDKLEDKELSFTQLYTALAEEKFEGVFFIILRENKNNVIFELESFMGHIMLSRGVQGSNDRCVAGSGDLISSKAFASGEFTEEEILETLPLVDPIYSGMDTVKFDDHFAAYDKIEEELKAARKEIAIKMETE